MRVFQPVEFFMGQIDFGCQFGSFPPGGFCMLSQLVWMMGLLQCTLADLNEVI